MNSRRKFLKQTGILTTAAYGLGFIGGFLNISNKAVGSPNQGNNIFSDTPDFIKTLPERLLRWQQELSSPEYFGLCKECIDSEIPFSFPASGVMLTWLKDFGMYERIPGYTKSAMKKTAKYVRSFQQKDTGFIIHPYMDERFYNKQDETAYNEFREAVTSYTRTLLKQLGSDLKYPFSRTFKEKGETNGDAFVRYVETSNWDNPWNVGSHAGAMAVELLDEINRGHMELIPALEKGTELILLHQNPETGMIGKSNIPLYEQISGALKVYPRLVMYMGMVLPHFDRLADSCIKHHSDRSFYEEIDNMCIPRNTLEMCDLCLEFSDYRREELLETISSVTEYIHNKYQMSDGLYASTSSGREAIGWCGASIAPKTNSPRSNINGTQGAIWAFGISAKYLGWKDTCLKYPRGEWQKNLTKRKYIAQLTPKGRVKVVPNPNYKG